jgi:hypothetical protein
VALARRSVTSVIDTSRLTSSSGHFGSSKRRVEDSGREEGWQDLDW